MTRLFFFLVCFTLARPTFANELVAFERGSSVWIANLNGTAARKVTRGFAPDLSPDGSRIAFQTDTSNTHEVVRQIAIANVETRQVAVYQDQIPSRNCQRPVWSPDGTHILFNIWDGDDWHIAIINPDSAGFRYVKKATPKHNSFWSICWAPDGHTFYAQDLNYIYQFDLHGTELRKWSIAAIFPKGGLSSAASLSLSPNGHKLVVDVEMQNETAHNLRAEDAPPTAIWMFDLAIQQASRLTPAGLSAWHPCWLGNDEILYCTQMREDKTPSIYKLTRKKRFVRLLTNANNQSIARQR